DVDALVGCIQKLYDAPTLYEKMSENAVRIFTEMFDADKIYKKDARLESSRPIGGMSIPL
ncbi:unnamed protein product, partial [marine sediment metagenome]